MYHFFAGTHLRLQGPSSKNGTGRLEVFYNGTWGTICEYGWNMNSARVACRQLGYKYTLRALMGKDVPDGSGPIWLDYVQCKGNEADFGHCPHRGWGIKYCAHHGDVGVECSSTGKAMTI